MTDIENVLRFIYYEPGHPASFSTAEKLYSAAKEFIPKLNINDVRKWLSGEFTYTLHKPVRKIFKRNPIIVEHIDQQWEADLVEMREFSSKNKKFNYILTVIDVMSKYAWVKPLKDKTQKSIVEAFKDIFKSERVPKFLRTDQGREFLNNSFKNLMKEYDVHHFTSKNQTIKCAIVERFNRTLKARMYKYFTSKGTRKWIDILPDLVSAYNNTYHRTIKMSPIEALESKNTILFKNIYGVETVEELFKKSTNSLLEKGDLIRKSYKPGKFDKSFCPNWTDRTYKVDTISNEPTKKMFSIKDENDQKEKQRYYPEEVQKISENLYRVEKVIKTRTKNGKKQHYVKWLNYPDNFNSWIEDDNLIRLNQ